MRTAANGTTATPTIESVEQQAHGTDEEHDERADDQRRQRLLVEALRAGAGSAVERQVQQQVHHEEDGDETPNPRQLRNDGPAPQQATTHPRHCGPHMAAEPRQSEVNLLATRRKTGRLLETSTDDDFITVDDCAVHHPHVSAHDDERPVDDSAARDAHLPEYDDDIAVDLSFDRRAAEHDCHFTRRIAGLEDVVLSDADDLASAVDDVHERSRRDRFSGGDGWSGLRAGAAWRHQHSHATQTSEHESGGLHASRPSKSDAVQQRAARGADQTQQKHRHTS